MTVDRRRRRRRGAGQQGHRVPKLAHKAELVLAAFIEGIQSDDDPPDTGTLRGDLVALGDMICGHAREHAATMRAVLGELNPASPPCTPPCRTSSPAAKALTREILERAVRRGEIEAGAIDTELWDVLPGYLVYRAVIRTARPLAGLSAPWSTSFSCPVCGANAARHRVLTSTLCRLTIGRLARKHWIVLLTVAVVALAAFAVYRTQSMFGKHADSGASSAMPDQIVPFNPKRVQLEVFGTPARRPPSPTSTSTRHPSTSTPAARGRTRTRRPPRGADQHPGPDRRVRRQLPDHHRR